MIGRKRNWKTPTPSFEYSRFWYHCSKPPAIPTICISRYILNINSTNPSTASVSITSYQYLYRPFTSTDGRPWSFPINCQLLQWKQTLQVPGRNPVNILNFIQGLTGYSTNIITSFIMPYRFPRRIFLSAKWASNVLFSIMAPFFWEKSLFLRNMGLKCPFFINGLPFSEKHFSIFFSRNKGLKCPYFIMADSFSEEHFFSEMRPTIFIFIIGLPFSEKNYYYFLSEMWA